MKKVVGLLLVLFTAAFLPAVSANQSPSIAIIDTAIDTTAKNLSGKVIYEVCVMETPRCPNQKDFMEGAGSASLPTRQALSGGFEHGTIMSSVAVATNPNLNIVFIRVVPMATTGRTGIYTERSVQKALEWVAQNKTKFNIVATSASIGHHNFRSQTNYCPVNPSLRNAIVTLQNIGVGTFFAAGNKYDYSRVDYPACISEAIAVGATGVRGNIELYSNGGNDIDFYSLGTFDTPVKRAMGTSAATVALASYWAKVYAGDYKMTYDYLKSVSESASNAKVNTKSFINTSR